MSAARAPEAPPAVGAMPRVAMASLLAAALALAAITSADPDLWGHVRFGMDLAHSWSLPSVDPYSFTQDRPWINHEWLSELQMGLAWMAAGTAGLALLKGALALVAWGLVWRALAGARVEARLAVTALVVVGTAQLTSTVRPQVWSLVCLGVVCRLLAKNAPKPTMWLPVIFALWANLHGGWLVGLAVVFLWAVVEMAGRSGRAGRWVSIGLACALATFATPYGWRLWGFMLDTVRLGRPLIEEWQPLWALAPDKWLVWLLGVVGFAVVLGRSTPRRVAPALATAVLAVASLRVARVVPLFIEAGAILVAPIAVARWPQGSRGRLLVQTRSDRAVLGVATVIALAAAVVVGRPATSCIAVDADARMPEQAPVALLTRAQPGRLVTFFNWGEYAIWHLGPAIRVSIDGRRETVYSDARLREHDAILAGTPDGLSTLARWRPEYVWLPSTSGPTREWLAGHSYRIEFQSDRSFLAVRDDLPSLGPVGPVTAGPRCFPR